MATILFLMHSALGELSEEAWMARYKHNRKFRECTHEKLAEQSQPEI